MKKDCFGCRALSIQKCLLGHDTYVVKRNSGKEMVVPAEECYKPTTTKTLASSIMQLKDVKQYELFKEIEMEKTKDYSEDANNLKKYWKLSEWEIVKTILQKLFLAGFSEWEIYEQLVDFVPYSEYEVILSEMDLREKPHDILKEENNGNNE